MQVVPYQEEIETIAVRAIGEHKLTKYKQDLIDLWKGTDLNL